MAGALVQAHIAAQAHLRKIAAATIAGAWGALPHYNRDQVPQFLAAAVPTAIAAQRQSVLITNAYLARALEHLPAPIDPSPLIGAALRNGTAPADVYMRPFVVVWGDLKAGVPWSDAVARGRDRAMSAITTDVQLAQRAALEAIQQNDQRITGYQRVADDGACAYCVDLDGARVASADALPLHPGCGCSVEPITDDFTPTALPDTVAVHDHGELGAYLAGAGDHFTTQTEALAGAN